MIKEIIEFLTTIAVPIGLGYAVYKAWKEFITGKRTEEREVYNFLKQYLEDLREGQLQDLEVQLGFKALFNFHLSPYQIRRLLLNQDNPYLIFTKYRYCRKFIDIGRNDSEPLFVFKSGYTRDKLKKIYENYMGYGILLTPLTFSLLYILEKFIYWIGLYHEIQAQIYYNLFAMILLCSCALLYVSIRKLEITIKFADYYEIEFDRETNNDSDSSPD